MESSNIEDSYPLSPMQQGMLFHYLSDSKPGEYMQQMVCDLHENLNIYSFKLAWEKVFNRHQIFRTSFEWVSSNIPVQLVHKRAILPFEHRNLEDLPVSEQKNKIDEYLKWDRYCGFDLRKTPIVRSVLFQLSDADYKFVMSYHHIILDGGSRLIVFRELFRLYDALCSGEELDLKKPLPYKNYIDFLYRQNFSKAQSFWTQMLKGFTAPTPLINLKLKADENDETKGHGEIEFRLSSVETSALRDWAFRNKSTLNTVIQLAWAILLSHYSGEKDVVFGSVHACRRLPIDGIDGMVGLFINTLPMRIFLSNEMNLTTLLKEIRTQQLSQREYQITPLVKVQEWSDVPAGKPLFESYIVFNNMQVNSVLQEEGESWKNRSFYFHEQTNYPLVLTAFGESEFLIKFSYAHNRFDQATIDRIAGHLKSLLSGFAKNHERNISDFTILTELERNQLIIEWNRTSKEYEKNTCLHQLFESQVDRTPDAVAVVYQDTELSYRELDQRANQLARHLRGLGIGPESLVGVFMERSIEMVVGLYGILKAGGAYVPLDPEYPKQRLAFMIEDTKAPVILTQKHLVKALPEQNAKIICLDSDWNMISGNRNERLENKNTEDNLAYAIYTSGSTGKPKGVMNEHRGICNRLFWMQDAYQLTEKDRILQKTPFSFDVSVWEFFWPLLFGAQLVVAQPGAHKDTSALVKLVTDHQITTIHFVPSMLQLFLEDKGVGKCQSLKRVICSGEALPYDLQERFFDRIDAELHNLYGPTEAAVDVTYWECQRESNLHIVPIGRPVANTQIYILNRQMRPVPIGVPGELHIGGIQVARGYINRPELTKETFIGDPFSKDPGAQLYKTGDLARYLSDGAIEYLSRMDYQVKIRGFRIELGEIESVLSQHLQVREAVVTASEDAYGSSRLVGYVVPVQGEKLTVEILRSFLEEKLPDYMVPALFIMLEAFPLTSSGKTDRKALPKPDMARPELEQTFVPPTNDIERKLSDIWCKVLDLDHVGVHDKFFSLGGNSLQIIQVASRIHADLNFDIPVAKMIQYPMISSLAKYIEKGRKTSQPSYKKAQQRAKLRKTALSRRKKNNKERVKICG